MHRYFFIFVIILLFFATLIFTGTTTDAKSLLERVQGRILLQVESHGEAWYVHPEQEKRYYLGRPHDAFAIMRELGIGITNTDLDKIPVALDSSQLQGKDTDGDGLPDNFEIALGTNPNAVDSDGDGVGDFDELKEGRHPNKDGDLPIDLTFAKKHVGRIFIQVQRNGEAWYIYPETLTRHYLGRPLDAWNLMRGVGLGAQTKDIEQITEGKTVKYTPPSPTGPQPPTPPATTPTTTEPTAPPAGPQPPTPPEKISLFEEDTTFNNDYIIRKDEKITVKNGATITFLKNLTIEDGSTLACQEKPLTVVVAGDFHLNGILQCQLEDKDFSSNQDIGAFLNIVVKGNFYFPESGIILTNGSAQFVEDKKNLATTAELLAERFDEVMEPTEEGYNLGPFLPKAQATATASSTALTASKGNFKIALAVIPPLIAQINGRQYLGDPNVPAPPHIRILPPPRQVRKIILLYDFGNKKTTLDFELEGPDSLPSADVSGGCDIDVPALEAAMSPRQQRENSNDALRLRVRAKHLVLDNFIYHAGNGGKGGDATTDRDCDPGKARAGNGGQSGNFKMTSTQKFEIKKFTFYPGKAGDGGKATAYGKNGEGCAAKGADAFAWGGNGADNNKTLSSFGNVSGINNIEIGPLFGGDGGEAIANPGNGGSCNICGGNGGNGGNGTAEGGDGGKAILNLTASTQNVGRTSNADESRGGDGGNATTYGGNGGDGGDCECDQGGDGGDGGDATATVGQGGHPKGKNGTASYPGGDGGDGGDGGPPGAPGKGGNGGQGKPPGNTGKPGKLNECPGDETTSTDLTSTPFAVLPTSFDKTHTVGYSTCPDNLGTVTVSGPSGKYWKIVGSEAWLTISPTSGGPFTEGQAQSLTIDFNCNVDTSVLPQSKATILVAREIESDGETSTGREQNIYISVEVTGS